MGNPLKKLAGQTAIYGLSSIVGRLLNFFLTPLYAVVYATDQFGIITEMYAYVAFLVVFLTYGLETAFFRFTTLPEYKGKPIYATILTSLFSSTLFFIVIGLIFSQSIADWLHYPNHNEYVVWFAIIVGLDAISSIPLAKLRADKKAGKFALVNLANIGVNIGLNVFFLMYCREYYQEGNNNWVIDHFYNPEIGVGYVFIANLIASIVKFTLLTPDMRFTKNVSFKLWTKLMQFAYPMLFVGLAGIVNETLDRIMIKKILFDQNVDAMGWHDATVFAQEQNGIYGANYKLAMIISLFIQAYRYAAEPFFFKEELKNNSKETYVTIMNYFVIVVTTMFLGITLFLSIFKYFIPNPDYWEGLKVVPILLGAYVLLGLYYNQSIWYKLAQKTKHGALISIFGAIITITINYLFIPQYGYLAAAWATFSCYGTMLIISYFAGKKYYPIPYNLKRLGVYIALTVGIYFMSAKAPQNDLLSLLEYGYNVLLIVGFLGVVVIIEKKNLFATTVVLDEANID